MTRFADVVSAPFRAALWTVESVGTSVNLGANMVFGRNRGWGFLLSRTRIDYKNEVGDPVANSMVGATVGWICRNFPQAPVRIVREDDPERTPIPRSLTGPGFMLRLLEEPNSHYDGTSQWMATVADFIMGNAYWIKKRAPSGRVNELWWVPSAMMEPRWPVNDNTVFISHYEYNVDGVTYIVKPQDVVHFRNGIDPLNVRKGLSRLGSLLREIFTDEESSVFTASLLRNLGVPGVILAPSNTSPGAKVDTEKVKQSFMEKFGGDRRGEPMVMSAPTDVKVLSWSPEQMNLRELRRIPEERTTAVLGVPAGVVGLGAGLDRNTFSNYGEARRAGTEEGIVPLHAIMAAVLEKQLLPDFADTERVLYDVFFDASVMAAMLEAVDAVWKRNESAATKGLQTRADWKRAVGMKPAADGSDDVYIIPNNFVVTPVGEEPQSEGGITPLTVVEDSAPAEEPAAAVAI